MNNVTIERTSDPVLPWIVLKDGIPLQLETLVVNDIASDMSSSFSSCYKAGFLKLFNGHGYFGATGGRAMFDHDVPRARNFMKSMCRTMGGGLKALKGRGSGYSIRAAESDRRKLEVVFCCAMLLVRVAAELGLYDGAHPLELQSHEARGRPPQTTQGNDKDGFASDANRFFRFSRRLWHPKRTSEVRYFGRIKKLVSSKMKPASVYLYILVCGVTGCRPGEPAHLTFGDWAREGQAFDGAALLRSKCDAGKAEKQVRLDAILTMFRQYVDGARRRVDPHDRGMADFELLLERARRGGDDGLEAQAILDSTAVLLNSRGRPLTYKVVWHHFDRAKAGEDMPVTLHFLRHEFVYRWMREADGIRDPAAKKAKLDALIAAMGWRTGEYMLQCYDAFHQKQVVDHIKVSTQRNLAAAAMGAAKPLALPSPVHQPANDMFAFCDIAEAA